MDPTVAHPPLIAGPLRRLGPPLVDHARAAGPLEVVHPMLPGLGSVEPTEPASPPGVSGSGNSRTTDGWPSSGGWLHDRLDGPLAAPPPTGAPGADDRGAGRDGPDADRLPDPEAWSRWLARLLVEVIQGRRPTGQLARWTDERVLATVVLRTRQLRSENRQLRREDGRGSPPGRLGTLRVQRIGRSAVETSAVIRGPRSRAVAFRLEARGDRWICTRIDFGPQTPQPG